MKSLFPKLKRCSLVLLSVLMLLALPACEESKGDAAEPSSTTQAPEQNDTSTPSGEDSKPQEDDTVELPKVEF